jgi:hypothetical protein
LSTTTRSIKKISNKRPDLSPASNNKR